MESSQQLRSLKRGLQALVLLNDIGLLTVSELARRIGVPRTTAHRILDTLVAEEYAERVPNGRGYQLTPLVRRLANGFDDESWITNVAQPLIERLSIEVKWPLSLTTPRGGSMLVRICTDHASPLALSRHSPGFITPMMRTTAGHVYLAFCNLEQRRLTLDVILSSPDPLQASARDAARLDKLLDKIRQERHMILEHPEYPEGSIGVPILVGGEPIACLVMRYIKSALNPRDVFDLYLGKLHLTAKQIADSFDGQSSDMRVRDRASPRPWVEAQAFPRAVRITSPRLETPGRVSPRVA